MMTGEGATKYEAYMSRNTHTGLLAVSRRKGTDDVQEAILAMWCRK